MRTLPAPELLVAHDAYVGEGPVWDPRIGRLLWVDIPAGTLFVTDPRDGSTTHRDLGKAVGIVLPRTAGGYVADGGGRPDGLTVDCDGGVWVATWPGYGVHRYMPDGTLDAVVPLPVSNVSSCELGGPDLRDLYITTAWELLSEAEHAAQPLAGSLFRTRVDVPGRPRVPFAG